MSNNFVKAYQVHRRKILGLGALIGLAALQYTNMNPISHLFTTSGVKNIENRFSAGGGTKTHVPGAATKLGSSGDVETRAAKEQGIGSDSFAEKPSGFDKAWNKMNYGKDKGK